MKKTAEEIIEESGFVHISKAEDRILYYGDVLDVMERYAAEAIKADRASLANDPDWYFEPDDRKRIVNRPIELK